MIYLAQVLNELNDLRCSVPAVLIGGVVDRGFSRNDIDLLHKEFSLNRREEGKEG